VNYNEIKSYILDMTAENYGGVKSPTKHDTCQYKGTDRYCKMTTNESCSRCRFYSPTFQIMFTAAYEEARRAKRAYKANVELEKEMRELWNELIRLRDASKPAVEEFCELHIADSTMTMLWQDSVNSYE